MKVCLGRQLYLLYIFCFIVFTFLGSYVREVQVECLSLKHPLFIGGVEKNIFLSPPPQRRTFFRIFGNPKGSQFSHEEFQGKIPLVLPGGKNPPFKRMENWFWKHVVLNAHSLGIESPRGISCATNSPSRDAPHTIRWYSVKEVMEKMEAFQRGDSPSEILGDKLEGSRKMGGKEGSNVNEDSSEKLSPKMAQNVCNADKEPVKLCGWVKSKRTACRGALIFLDVNDGSCAENIQVVFETKFLASNAKNPQMPVLDASPSNPPVLREQDLKTGTAVCCVGSIDYRQREIKLDGANKQRRLLIYPSDFSAGPAVLEKGGDFEKKKLQKNSNEASENRLVPISKKSYTDEYLRSIPHLRMRTRKYGAIMRVRSSFLLILHTYLQNERKFAFVNPPLLTSSNCEGAGDLFSVSYTQSGGVGRQGDSQQIPNDPEFAQKAGKKSENIQQSAENYGKNGRDCEIIAANGETINAGTNQGHVECVGRNIGKLERRNAVFSNLSVSGQFALEAACLGMGKVYTFSPVFRADPSNTMRHLSEFWMLEAEAPFWNLNASIHFCKELITKTLSTLINLRHDDIVCVAGEGWLQTILARLEADTLFARIKYIDAVTIILRKRREDHLERDFEGKPEETQYELTTHDEKILLKEMGAEFLFISDYPEEQKPFYAKAYESPLSQGHMTSEHGSSDFGEKRDAAKIDKIQQKVETYPRQIEKYPRQIQKYPRQIGKYPRQIEKYPKKFTKTFDLINAQSGEIAGGSEREDSYSILKSKMQKNELNLNRYKYYLDLRKYGSAPHAGFGIGIDRLLMYLLKIPNIRDVVPFPVSLYSKPIL